MTYRRSTVLLSVAFLALCVSKTYAQEHSSSSSSPSSSSQMTEEEQQWQQRFERAEGFRLEMLQTRRGVEFYYDFRKKNVQDVQKSRTKCQEDLRHANRDTTFPTLQRCYTKELMLNKELREKQKEYAESVPGVSEDMRQQTLAALNTLIDALTSMIEGTENAVFRSKEELIEAKKNLHTAYRTPTLLALLRMEADRTDTWIAHLMQRLFTMTQNTSLSPDAFAKASETMQCYEEAETEMQSIGNTNEFIKENGNMRATMQHLQHCAELLREAHTLQDVFEHPPVEPTEDRSMYSPRRRWSGQ